MVDETLLGEALRPSIYCRLFNQPIYSTALWQHGLKDCVLSNNAPNGERPSRICSRLRMVFNELVDVLEMTLAPQLHQGISNDILPSSIERTIRHASGIIAETDSQGEEGDRRVPQPSVRPMEKITGGKTRLDPGWERSFARGRAQDDYPHRIVVLQVVQPLVAGRAKATPLRKSFSLSDVYAKADSLAKLHPGNRPHS